MIQKSVNRSLKYTMKVPVQLSHSDTQVVSAFLEEIITSFATQWQWPSRWFYANAHFIHICIETENLCLIVLAKIHKRVSKQRWNLSCKLLLVTNFRYPFATGLYVIITFKVIHPKHTCIINTYWESIGKSPLTGTGQPYRHNNHGDPNNWIDIIDK